MDVVPARHICRLQDILGGLDVALGENLLACMPHCCRSMHGYLVIGMLELPACMCFHCLVKHNSQPKENLEWCCTRSSLPVTWIHLLFVVDSRFLSCRCNPLLHRVAGRRWAGRAKTNYSGTTPYSLQASASLHMEECTCISKGGITRNPKRTLPSSLYKRREVPLGGTGI
jgi:hypothetical protein